MKNLGLFKIMALATALALPAMQAPAVAQQPGAKEKPLRGVVRPGKRGGYSYKYNQGIDTRRFVDPSIQSQSTSGPFDSGFFFSSPNGPRGGDSPYMQ